MSSTSIPITLVATLAFSSALGSTAHAISFDADGTLRFDPEAVVKDSLDALPAAEPGARDDLSLTTETPLEGAAALVVPTRAQLPVALAPGRSYRVRVFVRGGMADVDVYLPADSGANDPPPKVLDPSMKPPPAAGAGIDAPESVSLYPTGRVTSDGWYELESAPVSVWTSSSTPVLGVVSLDDGPVQVDALEAVEEGTYRPLRGCVRSANLCAADEMCLAGVCQELDHMVPPLPRASDRSGVASYLQDRIKLVFGSPATRAATLPAALAIVGEMPNALSAWAYWNTFFRALHALKDAHTRVTLPSRTLRAGRISYPVCFVAGDADVTADVGPRSPGIDDVLVSHVASPFDGSGPAGNGNSGKTPPGVGEFPLGAGDRLVAIDGQHPLAFVAATADIDPQFASANDPASGGFAYEKMRETIGQFASAVTYIHCTSPTACEAPKTVTPSELYRRGLPAGRCDGRPAYHLQKVQPSATDQFSLLASQHLVYGFVHGPLADTRPEEKLFGAVFDDLLSYEGKGNDVESGFVSGIKQFREQARGVILDHRRGDGGYLRSAAYVTTLFHKPAQLGVDLAFNQVYDRFDPPFSAADGKGIVDYFRALPNARQVVIFGADNARADLKVAVLIERDFSASDVFAKMAKGTANVRLFGRRTAGAFSTFYAYRYYGLRWQLASGDLFAIDGTPATGTGVEPDEVVVPKQSELLSGRDPAHERALAWLRRP